MTYQVNRIIPDAPRIINTPFLYSVITLTHTTTIGHIGIIPIEVGHHQHLHNINDGDFKLKTYIINTTQITTIAIFQVYLYSTGIPRYS